MIGTCGWVASLPPRLRVRQARFVSRHADGGGSCAHRDARFVHHVEHAAQPFAGLADEIADRPGCASHRVATFTEVEQRIGDAAVAEFVVQAGECHVVALAGQLASRGDELLWHDE